MNPDLRPSRPTVPLWMLPPERPTLRSRLGRAPRTVALLASAAVVSGAVGGAVGATVADDGPRIEPDAAGAATPAVLPQEADSVSAIAARVLPSVVSLAVRSNDGAGSGSGVVLDDSGHILTNHHVVAPGADGAISVTFDDGRQAPARIVGLDPVTDLAVVDVDGVDDLRPIALGSSSEAQVGDPVVAVGSPLGLSGTVTTGILSALGRTVRTSPDAPLYGALQTDAAINPGNSGGALVDGQGRLIGINTAISTQGGGSIGLGFAIPVDHAYSIADQLIRTGSATHPSMGVSAENVARDGDGLRGVRLAEVPPASAAARGGLREGDVVTRVGDEHVAGVDELVIALRAYAVGDSVRITFQRDGDGRQTDVVLDQRRS